MGVSKKLHSIDTAVIPAGISLKTSLKPVFAKPAKRTEADEDSPTTPTYAESRIPARLPCPPAPKKRKAPPPPPPSRSCHYGGAREFFNPPDLDSIFMRRVEGS